MGQTLAHRGRGRHRATSGLGTRFQALFWGQSISQVGDYIAYLTVPLFVFQLTQSSVSLAISYSLETLPALIFGLVGGVMLDRVSLRWAMIAADLARAAAFVALGFMAMDLRLSKVGVVFALAFVIGTFSSMFQNGLWAILPAIVERNQLQIANSRLATSQQVALVVGPFIAGALAKAFGVAPGFFIQAGTFVVSAISVWWIGSVPARIAKEDRGSIIEEAAHGLRYLWSEPRLRASTIAAAGANAAVGFIESTLVVMGISLLGADASGIGTILLVWGLGGILGAVAAPRAIKLIGLGKVMTIGLLIFGTTLWLAVRQRFGVLALFLFFVMFVGLSLVNVPLATIRQTYTPTAMLGRVITASRTIAWSTLPLGALVGTAIANSRTYGSVARTTPLLLIAAGVGLLFTPIWKDTFGTAPGKRIAGP